VPDNTKNEQILAEVEKRKHQAQSAEAVEEKVEMVIFTLGDDFYAFYGHHVKEILPYEKITLVPGCPDSIIGLINVRGDIESVINLHKLLGIPESRMNRKTRIMIAAEKEIRSGILADSVEDVLSVPVSSVSQPISTLDKSVKEFAVGGETLYNGKYVTLLDIGKIFAKFRV